MYTDPQHVKSMHLPLYRPAAGLAEDARALEEELRREVEGEVRFDEGSRALYATDASNYRQVPIGLVVPRTIEDVVATVAACRRHAVPVLPRGAGTSLAGQSCNVAVVIDFTRHLGAIRSFDPERRLAVVQPGVVLDVLRHEAQRRHGLTFGPDPATHEYCTLGGMIGNDACGIHAQLAGRTSNNLEALEVLTFDGLRLRVGRTSEAELERTIRGGGRAGELYRSLRDLRDRYGEEIRRRFPPIPRRVSGYNNLDQLLPENGFHVARALAGTEGTCVTVLEATLNLLPFGRFSSLVVLGYPDVFEAADHIPEILEHRPVGLEGIDQLLVDFLRQRHLHEEDLSLLPPGGGWLYVQFWGDSREEAVEPARRLAEALGRSSRPPSIRLLDDPAEMGRLWKVRESGLGATARVPGRRDAWEGWEDSAVPPERMGPYLRELRALFRRHGLDSAMYGHFGQGCVHCRIDFDFSSREGLATFRAFTEDAAELVVSYGGSFSGEHGDGKARSDLLEKMYGPVLIQAFREFKAAWDPEGRMNPGHIVDPVSRDENLRFGPDRRGPKVKTHFRFAEDDGDFGRATERCVGVGKCRKDSGTMCPSYMVTREEMHNTRGRTRLLFEMLQGDAIRGGWRDEHVHEALDLCLSCKGCKGECPMEVDVATYKAEFLSHYYEGRLRPPAAYAFGLVHWWSRLAAHAPALANTAAHLPGLEALLKRLVGMAPQRQFPPFALRTFRRRHARRSGPAPGEGTRRRVLLWLDTFNDHFHPEVAEAAVEVLEASGFAVELPPGGLCCGRPLYEFGMLDLARRQLTRLVEALRGPIRAGVPIVALEPSCASVFRDELPGLLPDDPDARRLPGLVHSLAGFLAAEAGEWEPPPLRRPALLHGHCHQKSAGGLGDEHALYRRMGLDAREVDSGCCGMAGSFGFERSKYDVSIACGERVLLPEVRRRERSELVIADGFSCREQVEHRTGRRPLHTAQVLLMALREGPRGPEGELPESSYAVDPRRLLRRSYARTAAAASVLLAAALAFRRVRRSLAQAA